MRPRRWSHVWFCTICVNSPRSRKTKGDTCGGIRPRVRSRAAWWRVNDLFTIWVRAWDRHWRRISMSDSRSLGQEQGEVLTGEEKSLCFANPFPRLTLTASIQPWASSETCLACAFGKLLVCIVLLVECFIACRMFCWPLVVLVVVILVCNAYLAWRWLDKTTSPHVWLKAIVWSLAWIKSWQLTIKSTFLQLLDLQACWIVGNDPCLWFKIFLWVWRVSIEPLFFSSV